MRGLLAGGLCVLVASTFAAGQQPPTRDALMRLEEVRRALGGSRQIAAITSLSLAGSLTTRNQYYGRVPDARSEFQTFPFDIKILLPDHYVERQELQLAQQYWGFAGTTLLNRAILPGGRLRPSSDPASVIDLQRANFGYLVFFLTLRTDTVFPFEFRDADVGTLTFRSPRGVDISVEIDPATQLPLRFTYAAVQGDTDKATINVLEARDYRTVGALTLAHRLTLSRDNRLEMDRQLDLLDVNPALTPKDFGK